MMMNCIITLSKLTAEPLALPVACDSTAALTNFAMMQFFINKRPDASKLTSILFLKLLNDDLSIM